jgi:flavorubredoxin
MRLLEDIFTDDFMQEYTRFESFEGFRYSSAVMVNWKADTLIYAPPLLDAFVKESTDFATWDEMVRYYSNIVGKYGSPVQKALAKLGGLPISTICSTHGPVWTENIAKVIGIYDKLSRYAADEGVVIAYGSMYGNTEQMAEAIAAELSAQGIKNIVMHNVSKSNPSYIIADIFKYRGLIIGSPTYSNQIYPEIESLLSKILVREVKGRYLGYFGSFCWAGAAVKRVCRKEQVRDCGRPGRDEAGHEGHYLRTMRKPGTCHGRAFEEG